LKILSLWIEIKLEEKLYRNSGNVSSLKILTMAFPGPHFPGDRKIPANPFAQLSLINGAIGSFLCQFIAAIGFHISISKVAGFIRPRVIGQLFE
jgi:hypothetical protein